MCVIFKIHGVASLCNPTLLLVSPDILHQAATNNIYHFFVPNECVHCKIKSSAGNIKARHDHKHGLIKKSIHLKDMLLAKTRWTIYWSKSIWLLLWLLLIRLYPWFEYYSIIVKFCQTRGHKILDVAWLNTR